MAANPRISFAIPFYKNEKHLAHALESVFSQSLPDFECFVSNNGPGPMPAVLENFLKDPRFRYVESKEFPGLVGNWNRCLELARSPFVTILHDDDELHKDYAKEVLKIFEQKTNSVAVYTQAQIINEHGKKAFSFGDFIKSLLTPENDPLVELHGEKSVTQLLRGNFIFCPTLCWNLKVLGQERYDSRWKMTPDFDLTLRLLAAGHTIIGLPQKLYFYRRHSQNTTSMYTANAFRFEEEAQFYDHFAMTAQQLGWHKAAKLARKKQIVILNLGYCTLKDFLNAQWAAGAYKLKLLVRLLWA